MWLVSNVVTFSPITQSVRITGVSHSLATTNFFPAGYDRHIPVIQGLGEAEAGGVFKSGKEPGL